MTASFQLHRPNGAPAPIVASIPHSGLKIPPAVTAQLRAADFLPHQDWHLDQLYDFLPDLGVTVIQARYSRYVVDLNRSPHSDRLGHFWSSVVPAKTAFNQPLYAVKPSAQEIEQRLQVYYEPYHQCLRQQLEHLQAQFGRVYLLDLHSFGGPIRESVCLGDGNRRSCSEHLTQTVAQAFQARGYGVVRNKIFNGGYITRHYGQWPQVEALQIEVRYSAYLDESALSAARVPSYQVPEFRGAKIRFRQVFEPTFRRLTVYFECAC